MRVTYAAVHLRRMSTGKHLFAVDPGDGATEYVEIPLRAANEPVGFGGPVKSRPLPEQTFAFGEKVNLTVESVE
jgi:hypothetical protein